LSMIGIFIGLSVSKKIDIRRLKPIFGYIVLVMGLFIIVKEIILTSIHS